MIHDPTWRQIHNCKMGAQDRIFDQISIGVWHQVGRRDQDEVWDMGMLPVWSAIWDQVREEL